MSSGQILYPKIQKISRKFSFGSCQESTSHADTDMFMLIHTNSICTSRNAEFFYDKTHQKQSHKVIIQLRCSLWRANFPSQNKVYKKHAMNFSALAWFPWSNDSASYNQETNMSTSHSYTHVNKHYSHKSKIYGIQCRNVKKKTVSH